MKANTIRTQRPCRSHFNTTTTRIGFLLIAAASVIHGHVHIPSSRVATTVSPFSKLSKNDASTSKKVSAVEIGLRYAFLNMFGGLPISSPSAVDASAAFTRGSMPIPYGVHQSSQQQQQDTSFPNLDLKTRAKQQHKVNRWQRRTNNRSSSSSSSVKRSATSSSTAVAPAPTTAPQQSIATNPNTLTFVECMICGAISRTISQTITHPADTMKTLLQMPKTDPNTQTATLSLLMRPENFQRLMRGAGAKMVLSIPLGALNFAVLEYTKKSMDHIIAKQKQQKSNQVIENKNNAVKKAGIDFLSSSLSTITCSVLSTPQTVIMDNIMAGRYPNLIAALSGLSSSSTGLRTFYKGWKPSIIKQIPSYGLTWVFFEQLKSWHNATFHRPLHNVDNLMIGGIASAASVCIMIPMDTIKTRLVLTSQIPATAAAAAAATSSNMCVPYKGIQDCASRIIQEEGVGALYRGLTPRLMSVVPMIGIQFGVYEFMKKMYLNRKMMEDEGGIMKDGSRNGGVNRI